MTIPFGPQVLAPVDICMGKRKTRVIGMIDSGAPRTTVAFSVLKRLRVPICPSMRDGERKELSEGAIPTSDITLDEVRLIKPACAVGPIAAWATPKLEPAEVMVGMDFLKAAQMSIAFAPFFETVIDRKRPRTKGRGATWRLFHRCRFSVGRKSIIANALVDTGATDIVIPLRLARRLGATLSKKTKDVPLVDHVANLRCTRIDSVTLLGKGDSEAGPFEALVVDDSWAWPTVGTSYLAAIGALVDFKTGLIRPGAGGLFRIISQHHELSRSGVAQPKGGM